MPAPIQQRYNAKARGSIAGGSHKKRKRPRALDDDIAVIPSSTAQLPGHEEGRGKMSSKKRKRLDSYVSKKLKNEDRLRTLQLLASLAPSLTTSAALASTSTLGQNPLRPSSAKERLEKREDRLVRRGMQSVAKRFGEESGGSESEAEGSGDAGRERGKGKGKEMAVTVTDEPTEELVSASVVSSRINGDLGNGKRKGKVSKKASWNPNLLPTQPRSDSSDSSDFDSSDSANDSLTEAGPSAPSARSSSPQSAEAPVPLTEEVVPRPLKPPIPAPGLGGGLKRGADGLVIGPRVVSRPAKRRPGRRKGDQDDRDGEESITHGDESVPEGEEENVDEEGEDDSSASRVDLDDEEEDSRGWSSEDGQTASQLPGVKRGFGFKQWALNQMGHSTPSEPPDRPCHPEAFVVERKHAPDKQMKSRAIGPLGAQLQIPVSSLLDANGQPSKSTAGFAITRRPSVSEARLKLPILAEEQVIVEAIRMYPVVIIAGETGSGKTTQVPQMLYEAGFGIKGSEDPGMIAITQPRRVAAVSLSARVMSELNLSSHSSLVAHQIRYSSTTSPDTAIKFMTDGVLLRELASDFLLSRYSVVIVDEAHERAVNTDVLIGVLSRVAKLREKLWRDGKDEVRPLRLVIMSATLRIDDLNANRTLFSTPPPVIHIPGRQHPVTSHFSRKTGNDYVSEAYKKVCKIHARLPVGAILVFLTGQAEIQALCRKLERRYSAKIRHRSNGKDRTLEVAQKGVSAGTTLPVEETEAEDVDFGLQDDLAADVDDGTAADDPEALDSEDESVADIEADETFDIPMHVLPLYSLLPTDQQMQVFRSAPSNHRLVIVATNVAETSLTIPGIRYVVDSGRAKERHYDASTGVQSFQVSWISKASAAQRAGRAGRTGPGHCYRLYSSALYEDHFEAFRKPEILCMPIEGVVLQMKSMNIDQVVNFPFPTPPDRFALKKAENLLIHLGALTSPTNTRMISGVQQAGSAGGQVTELGKAMGAYPVSPRFAKMLVIGNQHGCLPYVVAIVACLSVGDPFLHERSLEETADDSDEDEHSATPTELRHIRSEEIREKEERKATRSRFFQAQAQFLSLGGGTSDMFKMLAAIGAYEYDPTLSFCAKNFLRPKAMQEIQQLRHQLSTIAKLSMTRLPPPSDTQLKVLRQVLTAGFIDQIAVRLDMALKKPSRFSSCRSVPYRAADFDEQVFIHPSSALFHRPPPDFVVFHEVMRTGKPWLKGVTQIHPAWLSELGRGMCSFSRPEAVAGRVNGLGFEREEKEREVMVVPHFRGLGVDLPAVRRRQRREGTRWVLVE